MTNAMYITISLTIQFRYKTTSKSPFKTLIRRNIRETCSTKAVIFGAVNMHGWSERRGFILFGCVKYVWRAVKYSYFGWRI